MKSAMETYPAKFDPPSIDLKQHKVRMTDVASLTLCSFRLLGTLTKYHWKVRQANQELVPCSKSKVRAQGIKALQNNAI